MPMVSDFQTQATKYVQNYSIIERKASEFSNLLALWQALRMLLWNIILFGKPYHNFLSC